MLIWLLALLAVAFINLLLIGAANGPVSRLRSAWTGEALPGGMAAPAIDTAWLAGAALVLGLLDAQMMIGRVEASPAPASVAGSMQIDVAKLITRARGGEAVVLVGGANFAIAVFAAQPESRIVMAAR